METLSKLYEQVLKEADYNWDIDPVDRSWFITARGELWGDLSHRFILKNKYKQEWDNLKLRNVDDSEIEEIFTNRLIQMGYVKIGELDEFYAIIYKLDSAVKNAIQGFAHSILKVRNISDTSFKIDQRFNKRIIQCTIGEISKDYLSRNEEVEEKQLCSGIFWILSDCYDLSDYELLMFNIPCDPDGNPNNTHSIELNSKSGNTYNHKKLWESEVKNNRKYRPYNKKSYDYYPRGRIEIANNRAVIYLNPHINKPDFIDIIKHNFGLFPYNISEIRIIADGSDHYQCFLDRG